MESLSIVERDFWNLFAFTLTLPADPLLRREGGSLNSTCPSMVEAAFSKFVVVIKGGCRGWLEGSASKGRIVFWASLILASKSTVFSLMIISDTLPYLHYKLGYNMSLDGLPLASRTLGHPSIHKCLFMRFMFIKLSFLQ